MQKVIDFMRFKNLYIILAVALMVCTGALYHFKGGFNYSVDYTGGTQIRLKFDKETSGEKVKSVLKDSASIKGVDVRVFSPYQILVRMQSDLDLQQLHKLVKNLLDSSTDGSVKIEQIDSVSPKIGKELRTNSLKAVLIALLLVLLYITLRFKNSFAIGAVIALVHDTLVICLFFLLTGMDISSDVIAAIILILGYSINDTIVIFSRIRDNIGSIKNKNLTEIVNISLTETMKRTLLTSVSTALVVLPLIIFGGETLRGLSFALLIGIIFGTYSSIFIASPVMLSLNRK